MHATDRSSAFDAVACGQYWPDANSPPAKRGANFVDRSRSGASQLMAKFVAAAAIDRGLPGAVALEARAHTGGDLFLKDFAFGNRAVTGLAFHGGPGVNRMAEEDKIRQ